MTMNRVGIEDLVDDLTPVRPIRPAQAIFSVAGLVGLAVLVVALLFGLRPDVLDMRPDPMVLIRGGMLLLLGGATLGAVIRAGRPAVGQQGFEWIWVLAAAMLFPLTAIILSMIEGQMPMSDLQSPSAPYCLGVSLAAGLAIGAAQTAWLRRGAPTNPTLCGWLVGISGGSFGAFAYSLHCPSVTVYYVGLWYSLAVALCAVTGRLIVPRLIRW